MSGALLARYRWGRPDVAGAIESAVEGALASGIRTPDIAAPGEPTVGTEEMGQAVLDHLGLVI